MKIFNQHRTIMFGDCDNAQIVFYPNYFQWFDRATQNMFNDVGLPWSKMWPDYNIAGVPLVDAQATFMSPLRMEDEIIIDSWVDDWSGKVGTIRHNIRKGDVVHVKGTEKRVWAAKAPDTAKGIRAELMPEEIRNLLTGK
ncbi:MAG: acyl-CoA thioesterase [Rhodospirillales bacterium]|jgi:4-hydroxybenzoyl-CoA thioesterase